MIAEAILMDDVEIPNVEIPNVEIPTETEEQFQFKTELQRAVNFANSVHAGQLRKDSNLPYIVHPMEVLSLLSEWGVTDLVAWKAALCHDVLEERPDIALKAVISFIGKEAALVVEELTFRFDPLNNLPHATQKELYMKSFMSKSIRAITIKMADRCRNTCNFMVSKPEYAGKYWRKGVPLFDAMFSHGERISEILGLDVFPRMKYAKDSISRQLVR